MFLSLTVFARAGLNAELFYVREGVINEYALNFIVPVPAHIQDIYFMWQSTERPVTIFGGFFIIFLG